MVTLFSRRLDEMYIQPFHELVANGSVFITRLGQIQDDK
jgi:hypothetical protein